MDPATDKSDSAAEPTTAPASEPATQPPLVLKVREGRPAADGSSRIFSVVTSRAVEDLQAVATAADATAAIPTPGSPHPSVAGLVARPPLVFPQGSRFFNVRVNYVAAEGGS